MNANPTLDSSRVARPTNRLVEIAKSHLAVAIDRQQQAARERRIEPLLKALTSDVFRLVVMGEIKKGKSSFINALLGQKGLLPTDVDIATATVFKIVYGKSKRVTVFYYPKDDDSNEQESETIECEDLWIFGTERGAQMVVEMLQNGSQLIAGGIPLAEVLEKVVVQCPAQMVTTTDWERWQKRFGKLTVDDARRLITNRVDFIAIELPNSLLTDGVAIVDTPGVGGLFKRHRDVTFRYAPQADAVFFVLDSAEAPISEDEIKFLKELRKNTQHIVFLQTKIDIAGNEQIESWRERNLDILADVLRVPISEIPYFLVGANLKDLADRRSDTELLRESGYLDVLKYLKEVLMPRRDEILARKWLPVLGTELVDSAKQVSDRLAIAAKAHLPQIEEYGRQLESAESEFDRWQSEMFPGQLREFQDHTGRLKRETRNQLQDYLAADSRECLASLDELRSRCKTADAVNTLGEDFLCAWAATWNRASVTILGEFQKEFLAQCDQLFESMSTELQLIRLPNIELEPALIREYRVDHTEIVRNTYMNYSIFGSIGGGAAKIVGAGAALAVAGGILTAPIGLTIAAAAGVGFIATKIWATVRGFSQSRARQRDAAIVNVERAMQKTSQSALKSSIRAFEDLAAECESAARTQIDSFRTRFRNDFATRRNELKQAVQRTEAESKAAVEGLKSMLGRYQELLKAFQAIKHGLEDGVAP